MRAVVIHAAKDLRVEEYEAEAVGPGEVAVAVEMGGICGSDLHYFNHGGFGAVRLRQPMILGHEVAGRIVALGDRVAGLAVGDRVAVSPSRPCATCAYCLAGLPNQCLDMRFYGSAMPFPHIQGAFRQRLVALASQCHKVADEVSIGEAALSEPFAVTLHAVDRAGIVARPPRARQWLRPDRRAGDHRGAGARAREIVATDVAEATLGVAARIGADRTINVAREPEALAPYGANKGTFDVQFEASGNGAAVRSGLDVLRPRGVLVQIGVGGDIAIPQSLVVAKEIEIRGTFRFHTEFALAVDLINRRRVDLKPLLTSTYPFEEALAAFEAAGDRSRSMKVQLAF